ncbi:DUF6232 family protein [Methylophilus flavus]|uniref:DUF6232 family protein n=1 Tax=Methylophilus flavus TaxID=640084 RepID=A0ABW3PAT0_9PROT
MEETIFFSHQGISVCDSRFIVNGKAIYIQNVTSVESKELKPDLSFAKISLFGGLGLLSGTGNLPLVGVISIIYSATCWFLTTPKYAVVIHTSAGNIHALVGKDILDLEIVLSALNVAIASKKSPQ